MKDNNIEHNHEHDHGHEHHDHGHDHDHSHDHHEHDSTCDCGHDHSDTDTACDCGHDHSDTDAACDCGHDHSGHDHSHHDHDHDHSEEMITVYSHDSSVVGTVRCVINQNLQEASEIIKQIMKDVGGLVDSNGGTVGHIKAYLNEEGESMMLSFTDVEDEVDEKSIQSEVTSIELVSIVFGVSEEDLRAMLSVYFVE